MRELTHGTYAAYKAGDRCDDCKAAYAEQRRNERDAKRRAALSRNVPVSTWTGPVSHAYRIQKPDGWGDAPFRALERAS